MNLILCEMYESVGTYSRTQHHFSLGLVGSTVNVGQQFLYLIQVLGTSNYFTKSIMRCVFFFKKKIAYASRVAIGYVQKTL